MKTSDSTNRHPYTIATALSAIAVLCSSLHFWPFADSRLWQLICPSNSAVLAWIVLFAVYLVVSKAGCLDRSTLPHISIFAYVLINVLSLSVSPDLVRSAGFLFKLILMFIAAYMLFGYAISSRRRVKTIYALATTALTISVSYCLLTRIYGFDTYGFHGSVYKYGTYVGMLTALCGTYLILSSNRKLQLLAVVLICAAILSAGSLGAICAIASGIIAAMILTSRWSVRCKLIAAMTIATLLLIYVLPGSFLTTLRNDIILTEDDNVNVRQRYIEWQAELNMLEKRTITGTAAGCINEYRSKFYYRLPKSNTLKAFDQNGYLATAAETGILGLACFCWIIVHHFRFVHQAIRNTSYRRFAIANYAALVAACTANLFSSVYYNGNLIIFVMILALIARTCKLSEESHENTQTEIIGFA